MLTVLRGYLGLVASNRFTKNVFIIVEHSGENDIKKRD